MGIGGKEMTKKNEKGYEVMDLSNVNPYDDESVYRCGKYLCLRYHKGFRGAGPATVYEIALDRLNTPEKLYQWVIHLLEKNWITRDMLARMVRICEAHFNYDAHRFIEAA